MIGYKYNELLELNEDIDNKIINSTPFLKVLFLKIIKASRRFAQIMPQISQNTDFQIVTFV